MKAWPATFAVAVAIASPASAAFNPVEFFKGKTHGEGTLKVIFQSAKTMTVDSLGTAEKDAQGRDLLVTAEPKEFAEFKGTIRPRDLRMFFGALDPSALGFSERLIRHLPAARAVLPEGDFRDWKEIDAWAGGIAHELAQVRTHSGLAGGTASDGDAAPLESKS